MYDKAGIFRTAERLVECLDTRARAARARRQRRRRRQGRHASTPTSRRSSSSSRCSRRPTASSPARLPARSRAARTHVSTIPDRDDEKWMRHTLAWHDAGEVRLDYKPVTVTQYPARGSELLTHASHDQDPPLARRLVALARDVHGRGSAETATLLDVLDAVKDSEDGSLAYRKSCRMAVCGSCGMRMDGGGRAGLQDRDAPARRGRPRPDDLGDGQPAGDQGPGRRHDAVLGQDPRGQAVPRLRSAGAREGVPRRSRGAAGERSARRRSASCAGAASRSATRWRPTPTSSGLRRSPRRSASSATSATPTSASDCRTSPARTGSGTARAATSATSAARRASIRATRSRSSAPRRSATASRATRARSTPRSSSARPIAAGSSRRPSSCRRTIGPLAAAMDVPFALRLARAGKVPNPLSAHKAKDNDQVKRLFKLLEAEYKARPDSRPSNVPRSSDSSMQQRYAYYPGCLASLSAKELDTSTRAVARKLEIELVDMESTTCCGAGDIHEAKPEYYLHLNARILGQAEALGCDTLLTICNVCTLNLRQANKRLREHPDELERVNANLAQVGAPRLRRRRRGAAPALGALRGRRLRALQGDRRQEPDRAQGRAVLRLPDPAAEQGPRIRGSGQPAARSSG